MRHGFEFQAKQNFDLKMTVNLPEQIRLAWIDGKYINERAMLNDGKYQKHNIPVTEFERILCAADPPGPIANPEHIMVSQFLLNPVNILSIV